jgi:hypothetical protein
VVLAVQQIIPVASAVEDLRNVKALLLEVALAAAAEVTLAVVVAKADHNTVLVVAAALL